MSMNINELQALNDHLNAMQKAMETLAGLEERIKKLEEMHEHRRTDLAEEMKAIYAAEGDTRPEWVKSRDEVWKHYPQAFSQPTIGGYAVLSQMIGCGGREIGLGEDKESAWIDAAKMLPCEAAIEAMKTDEIVAKSNCSTCDGMQQSFADECRICPECGRAVGESISEPQRPDFDYESLAATNGDSAAASPPQSIGVPLFGIDHPLDPPAQEWCFEIHA